MTVTPELLELLAQPETRQAIAFQLGLADSELPEKIKPNRLDPWQRELWKATKQLRRVYQALSPNTLAAVAAEPARRSNFGNVGPSEW